MTAEERIDASARTRQMAVQAMTAVLAGVPRPSEIEFCDALWKEANKNAGLHARGWYDPPPGGASALFAPASEPVRLLYDSLRKKEFWPSAEDRFADDSVGVLYLSPVDRESGMIGDFGLTVYNGSDKKIRAYLKRCLEVVEQAADFAAVGMEFREIHGFAQKLMETNGLTNARTLAYTDTVGTNIGHTVPWSYEDPTPEEAAIIGGSDFESLKHLISKKRVHVNREERFKVPATGAFTAELRMEDFNDPAMPNAFFHLVVTFKEGKKKILGGFNEVFRAAAMPYLSSKF